MGIVIAIICYYIVHEGAHYLVAFFMGTFKQIIFMGLGVQVDVFRENMTDFQLGIFCLAGALATLAIAVVLIFAAPCICKAVSKVFRACLYYITIVFLFLDPLYLSVLCGFFGGGDMNGIGLLCPEVIARVGFGVLFLINIVIFIKAVLPKYKESFASDALQADG